MRSGPSVRFIKDRDGRRVAYASHGQGPTLVCPAWWVSHLEIDWEQPSFRAFFEHIGEVATVVRYDRPGVGLSDPCTSARNLDDETALLDAVIRAVDADTRGARQLDAELAGAAPVDSDGDRALARASSSQPFDRQALESAPSKVSLLGLSCGGPPAIRWAVEYPERVERLILFGTYARGADLAPADLQDALCQLVRAHWGAGARALSDVFMPDGTAEERDGFAQLQREVTDAETAERWLRLTYDMDASDALTRVSAPTHVIHRRGDRAIPFASGRELAATIAGARLTVLEGRNHPAWMGDAGAHAVADILRGIAPRVSGGCRIDEASRELVCDGQRHPLTPLELGLLRHLVRHAGEVVSRETLLDRVWEQRVAGSNVVDAVVRTVRRKLGEWAPSIETVTGHGYRFRTWQRKAAKPEP